VSSNTGVTLPTINSADPPAPKDAAVIGSTLERPTEPPVDGDEPVNKAAENHPTDANITPPTIDNVDPLKPKDGAVFGSTLKRSAESPVGGDEPASKATKNYPNDDLSAALARMRERGYDVEQMFSSFMQAAQLPASSSTGTYAYPACT
jgi:hypothetical protein